MLSQAVGVYGVAFPVIAAAVNNVHALVLAVVVTFDVAAAAAAAVAIAAIGAAIAAVDAVSVTAVASVHVAFAVFVTSDGAAVIVVSSGSYIFAFV